MTGKVLSVTPAMRMGTPPLFSETHRHSPAAVHRGHLSGGSPPDPLGPPCPPPPDGEGAPKVVTKELVFREAQEPSWGRGAGSPNYKFL